MCGNQRNQNRCKGWQKLSQRCLTDVQEVEEPGPGMQKGEGHLKVPHFRTGEVLSLQCALTGLLSSSCMGKLMGRGSALFPAYNSRG